MIIITAKSHINQVTLLLDSGLILHDETFQDDNMFRKMDTDSDLYGRFIAGILAFSAELGSELKAIKREDDNIYFFRKKDIILVIRASSELSKEEAASFFQRLTKNPSFQDLVMHVNNMIVVDKKTKDLAKRIIKETYNRYIKENSRKYKVLRICGLILTMRMNDRTNAFFPKKYNRMFINFGVLINLEDF